MKKKEKFNNKFGSPWNKKCAEIVSKLDKKNTKHKKRKEELKYLYNKEPTKEMIDNFMNPYKIESSFIVHTGWLGMLQWDWMFAQFFYNETNGTNFNLKYTYTTFKKSSKVIYFSFGHKHSLVKGKKYYGKLFEPMEIYLGTTYVFSTSSIIEIEKYYNQVYGK